MTDLPVAKLYAFAPLVGPTEPAPSLVEIQTFIVLMRRSIRRIAAVQTEQRYIGRQYRREASRLRQRAMPFDAARIAALDAAVSKSAEACKEITLSLKTCGRLLFDACPTIDRLTTLEQRCEILNVNVADRAGLTEADGIRQIVFGHGLEDSAWHRGGAWKDGPLYHASHAVFVDFLMNTAEGQQLGNSLFQPGGMFAQVRTFRQEPDGSMKRQPPRLQLVPDTPAGA